MATIEQAIEWSIIQNRLSSGNPPSIFLACLLREVVANGHATTPTLTFSLSKLCESIVADTKGCGFVIKLDEDKGDISVTLSSKEEAMALARQQASTLVDADGERHDLSDMVTDHPYNDA